ncbi:CDF family Co(II)/Ni(II) efflux transporter DmeF [Magnetospira sp. QH-2]|uniref:CDF family Co(II)/Ni(II) efflux transporter DmeF n=1 Tax=Magnetospira sp. (strain QH-2) TaxID=1288970 RepID=UPI0003E819B7|nr:CDF family Co(II)/Ni(II) efflux transporter DmeF [Magnetospira sp. QH-2]CCQ72389.1 Putative Co/Zn/Cd efflux system component [Magnetospira sp. QH-2]
MHIHSLDDWRHEHVYIGDKQARGESRATLVIALTVVMMVVEILGGWWFGSMALLADGWHMASHAAALLITVFAYRYARRHLHDRGYTFGTGKVGVLGGFTSGIVLGMVALLMVWESVERLAEPVSINFDDAMLVAALGLVVNLASAFLLHGGHDHHHHGHGHDHHDHHHNHAHDHHDHTPHGHEAHGQDHNLRAAFLHVMADALTSVLAIAALFTGKHLGWVWMDPLMGIVGAIVIGIWTYGLVRDTSRILLDGNAAGHREETIKQAIEGDSDNRVVDLHVWQVGPTQVAAIVSIVTHFPRSAEHYKALLAHDETIAHLTVEVNVCSDTPCLPKEAGSAT